MYMYICVYSVSFKQKQFFPEFRKRENVPIIDRKRDELYENMLCVL